MRTGIPGFQGYRLQQAREAIGLSKTSLAELVDVSLQAISQYEKGADRPGAEVFDRLRKTLRQDASFFLRPPNTSLMANVCFYRSLASTTKTARNKAEAWKTWSRELISYISEMVEFPPPDFPSLDKLSADPLLYEKETIDALASDVREHWKLGDGPIANLTQTIESKGAVAFRYSLDAQTLDALSEWLQPENFPIIILNADKSIAVRSRLDLAHELGHMFLHREIAQNVLRHSNTFRLVEEQAFRFGASLLLPEHSFLEDLYSISLDALMALKLKWKVSVAMMIERLKDLNVINEDQHRRLRINYSARRWNREEPYDREIEIEQPQFLPGAIKLLVSQNLQSVDQIGANTGFSGEWIKRLLNLPPEIDALRPKLRLVQS